MASPTFVDFVAGSDKEPVVIRTITHEGNDYMMWEAAGLYLDDPHNQFPDGMESDVRYALQTIERDPEHFRLYELATAGSTTLKSVLDFLNKIIEGCEDYPGARITVRN